MNDLTVAGAIPRYLSVAFILEEGLCLSDLRRVVQSMATAAAEAGVEIVTGDTKVVERGHGSGIYLTTAGVGFRPAWRRVGASRVEPGDLLLVNGGLAEHGIAVFSVRAGLRFETEVKSDVRPLNHLIADCFEVLGSDLKFLRDPTRGGVATTAKELALSAGMDLHLWENKLPSGPGGAELLGCLGPGPALPGQRGQGPGRH